jgi:hypothetical protein
VEIVDGPDDKAWDDFCATSPSAWFWHTTAWRDYTLAYRPQLASQSRAFFVVAGDEVVAAVPLMLEQDGTIPELSFGGGDCWAPALAAELPSRRRLEALRRALTHADDVARAERAVRASFRWSPLVGGLEDFVAFLAETTRSGYADASTTATVVDLSQPRDALLHRMTKGHRSDITRAARSMTVEVTDKASVTPARFDEYRVLHEKAAGRVTRPARTFELMEEWISQGTGLLVTARKDGQPVSCAYLNLYRDGAYYSSAATDPLVLEPAGHLVQWSAMEWLQAHGFLRYELGRQQFGPLPHDVPSTKELNIARFKRGFGGTLVPVPVREKWFDPEAFRVEALARTAAYTAALESQEAANRAT